MIILDATTKAVTIQLSASVTTNQLPFVTAYADITTTSFTGGEQDGVSSHATRVTILSSPATSTQRQLKYFSLRNADTVAATTILEYNNNGTYREIYRVALSVDDTLLYVDGRGFYVLNSSGAVKSGTATGVNLYTLGASDIAGVSGIGVSASAAPGDHIHRGLQSLNASGNAPMFGSAYLKEGTNITLTQSGTSITITGAAGGASDVHEARRYAYLLG